MLTSTTCSPTMQQVVYPQVEVYNLFGWDNYILWSNVHPLVPLQERSDSLHACVFILISRSLFQVRERTGIVHGWNLQMNVMHQRAVIFLGSEQWGAAMATNSHISAWAPPPIASHLCSRYSRASYNDDMTGQSLLVSGTPSSPGYRAWVLEHHDDYSIFVDSLSVPQDALPELGTCGFSVARCV